MATVRRELQIERLPLQASRRFIRCISGQGLPRPIWQQPEAPEERWKLLLIIGAALSAVLALFGSDALQGFGGIVLWMVAAIPLGWGAIGWIHAKRRAKSLPFPQGSYLFGTELIQTAGPVCNIYDLEVLTDVRVRPAPIASAYPGTELQLVFQGQIVPLRVAGQQVAQRIIKELWSTREALSVATTTGQWDQVANLDPLYEARYGGSWEQLRRLPANPYEPVVEKKGWLGLPSPVVIGGLAAGLLLAPLLWFVSDLAHDELSFSQAESTNTVTAWKNYLVRGSGRHKDAVRSTLLPAAALRVALADGSPLAVREFLEHYPTSTVAAQARATLHGMYEQAEARAREEMPPEAAEQMTKLLRWLDANQTAGVHVRFGASSQALLSNFDDFIDLLQRGNSKLRGIEIAPMAPAFSPAVVRQREDAIIGALQRGLAPIAPSGLLLLQRGPSFSGTAAGFDTPAVALECVAQLDIDGERPADAHLDIDAGKIYLPLLFTFKVNLAVPGEKPFTVPFSFRPTDYFGENEAYRKSLYDKMADMAFDELHQRLGGLFYPKHLPERAFRLSKVAASARPARASGAAPETLESTATGFCVSSAGYIVTANHFVTHGRKFKVVTPNGRVAASVVRQDATHDLALLKVDGSFPALALKPSGSVKLGEQVLTIGFPNTTVQGREPKLTDGRISSLAGMQDNPTMFQISVPVQPGNSGGPLVDMHGNVVGVIAARLNFVGGQSAQNVNYAVKSSILLNFLESISDVKGLPSPVEGPVPANVAEKVRLSTFLLEGYE